MTKLNEPMRVNYWAPHKKKGIDGNSFDIKVFRKDKMIYLIKHEDNGFHPMSVDFSYKEWDLIKKNIESMMKGKYYEVEQ